jgi:hypothetical protein
MEIREAHASRKGYYPIKSRALMGVDRMIIVAVCLPFMNMIVITVAFMFLIAFVFIRHKALLLRDWMGMVVIVVAIHIVLVGSAITMGMGVIGGSRTAAGSAKHA